MQKLTEKETEVNYVRYSAMTNEALLDAAKYDRCSPDLVKALAERLEDLLAELEDLLAEPTDPDYDDTDD